MTTYPFALSLNAAIQVSAGADGYCLAPEGADTSPGVISSMVTLPSGSGMGDVLAHLREGGGDSDRCAQATGLDYIVESSVGEFMLGSRPNRALDPSAIGHPPLEQVVASEATVEPMEDRDMALSSNGGQTSRDRALNFAVTNTFQAAATFAEAIADRRQLDTIEVEKSPYCRLNSDCWDVLLTFYDPEDGKRSRQVFRFTLDVADTMPVTVGRIKRWAKPGKGR